MTNKIYHKKDVLPNPAFWKKDGVDHLNISPKGLTDLGRTLHPNSMLGFTHDVFGDFGSVSAFWDFVETGSRHDNVRYMNTAGRMSFMKNAPKYKVDGLLYFVLDAMWQRVNTYKLLSKSLLESELPFDSYVYLGEFNYPTRRNNSTWMIKGFEEMRSSLKNNTTPDFHGLMFGKTREELFEVYLETYVKPLEKESGSDILFGTASNKNLLLEELRSSSEVPKAFRKSQVETQVI